MREKTKAVLISFILVLSVLLAACQAQDDNDTVNSENNGHISGELTIWGWDVAASSFEMAIEDFNKQYPDVKVRVEDFDSGSVYEKLTVGLASNGSGLPDVVLMEDERIPGYLDQFPDGFMNLSELGFAQHAAKFSDAKMAAVQSADGHIVAAPWDFGPAGVFYRVDFFEEAGVDPQAIKTWDDYIEAGKKIKQATGAKMLPIDVPNYDGVFSMMLQQQGTSYFDQDGNIALTSDEAVKAMSVIKQLHDNDLVANNDGWNGIVTVTVNGTVATVPYGVWYTGTIKDQAPELAGKWGAFLLPAFEEGGVRYANVGGSSLLIPTSTKNSDAAYAFVEFFTVDPDIQMKAFKEYGLFPSLLASYDDPYFDEEDAFFNNEAIYRLFADVVPEIPEVNITAHNARASDIVADAQAAILLNNESVKERLKQAAEQLARETK